MPDAEVLFSFLVTAVILEVTPGPNMAWLALLSATAGRTAGAAAVAGITLGLAVQAVLSALGLGVLIAAWPGLHAALQLAGVAYLIWLSYESWRDSNDPSHHQPGGGEDGRDGFRRGLVTNLLNPKAALFFVAVLPGFLSPGAGVVETLALSGLYLSVATAVHGVIVVAAGGLRAWIADPGVSVMMHRVQAVALLAVAIWLFWRG